ELFFRQAVGRLVSCVRGLPRQAAYLFIPDAPRLRAFASQIAAAPLPTLRRPERDPDALDSDVDALVEMAHPAASGAQDSQFAALSAVVTGADESSVFEVDEAALDRLDQLDEQESAPDAGLELPLPALPGSAPTPDAIVLAGRVTPRER